MTTTPKPMQGLAAYLRCEARALGVLSNSHKVLIDWAVEVEQAARNSGAAIKASQPLTDDVHSCSFFCDLPACIKTQRDLLRDQLTKDAK